MRFSTDQTANNAAPTAAELAAIYAGGTVLATVTPTGAASPYTATLTTAAANWAAAAPGTYYVYAILNPDPGASCRPVQEIIVTIAAPPTFTLTQTAPTCTGTTSNNNGKITLTSASNTDKCGISTLGASTYDGPAYASATAYTANKDVKTAIPNTGGTYILRLYNGSDICYKDTTITVLPTVCVVGSIGDYVWKDANRNGKQDGTETGVNGVQVILWSATTTGTPIAKLDSMTTAGTGANAGKYLFSNLPKGDYVVQFVKSTIPAECSGFTAKDTTAAGTTNKNDSDADKVTGITAKITLDPKALSGTSTPADSLATNNLTVDAGLVAPQGSLGDFVWKDTNSNGNQDGTETGVNGVQVIQWSATTTGTPSLIWIQ